MNRAASGEVRAQVLGTARRFKASASQRFGGRANIVLHCSGRAKLRLSQIFKWFFDIEWVT